MTWKSHSLIVIAAAAVLLCGGAAAVETAYDTDRVVVQQEAQVPEGRILLGDIAVIEGAPASVQRLAAIAVGRTALAGKERRLNREQIIAAMRQDGVEVKKIAVDCPREIKIQTAFQEISVQKLEAITRSFVVAAMPWDKAAVTIEDFTAKPVQLPTGDVTWRVVVQPNEDYLGKFNADVIFSVNGSERQRVRVSAVIRVVVPVAVTAKSIDRHAPVSAADVAMQPKDLSMLPQSVITDPGTLGGKRSKISIAAGTLLRQEMFESDTAVRKGDMVTLALNSPQFTITVPGEALESGNPGDVIPVANMNSRNKVYGCVKDNKAVEVRY